MDSWKAGNREVTKFKELFDRLEMHTLEFKDFMGDLKSRKDVFMLNKEGLELEAKVTQKDALNMGFKFWWKINRRNLSRFHFWNWNHEICSLNGFQKLDAFQIFGFCSLFFDLRF